MAIKPIVKSCLNGVLIILLLNSCAATKIGIEVLRPPELTISVPLKKVAFINRVGVSDAQTVQYLNGTVVAQYNGVSDYLVQETLNELVIRLNENQYFTAFDTSLNYIPKNGGFGKLPLPITVINQGCKSLKVDAFGGIEGYSADIDTDSEVRYSTPVERNHGTVRIPYFDGEQSVYMRMFFRIYVCDNEKSMLDDERDLGTQVSLQASGSTPYELNAKMVNPNNVLIQAARKLGRNYAHQISPQWETQQRKIYISGSSQMKEAYLMAKNGNWKEATDNWYLIATSNNHSLAAKATYNLILANEIIGDFKLAKEWASLCISKYKMKDAVTYLKVIQKREMELIEISQMFPEVSILN